MERLLSLWLSGAALAFGLFILITRELMEGEVNAMDTAIMRAVVQDRSPWLTARAVDITALGSVTLVILFTALALGLLLVLRDRIGALQLLAASIGASILTTVTKDLIERARPAEAQRLITVSGFSYPSGHSASTTALYLTLAILAASYVPRRTAKATMFVAASIVFVLVAASRVYLGVHYATDVLSGISLGAAWSLLLAGLFTFWVQAPRRAA